MPQLKRAQASLSLGLALTSKVNRHRVPTLHHVRLQRLENAPGLADEMARVLVEREHALHPREREHHLVRQRHAATHKPCVAALRHDSNALTIAVLKDAGNLLR